MEDIAAAVSWVHSNIAQYNGDPRRIFLSGHSAGGNIVALLVCGDWLSHLPENTVKGVICVSGVFSLHKPLGSSLLRNAAPSTVKNKIFHSMYVQDTFGNDDGRVDDATIINNSPT